jgi:hypothetical protein
MTESDETVVQCLRDAHKTYKVILCPLEKKGAFYIEVKDRGLGSCGMEIDREEATALWRVLNSNLFHGPSGLQ